MVTLNLKVIGIVAVAVYIITKYFIFGLIPVLILGAVAFWAVQKWGTVRGNTSNQYPHLQMDHRSSSHRPGTQVHKPGSYRSYDHRSHSIYDPIPEVVPLTLVLTSGYIFFLYLYRNDTLVFLLVWDDNPITLVFNIYLLRKLIPIREIKSLY